MFLFEFHKHVEINTLCIPAIMNYVDLEVEHVWIPIFTPPLTNADYFRIQTWANESSRDAKEDAYLTSEARIKNWNCILGIMRHIPLQKILERIFYPGDIKMRLAYAGFLQMVTGHYKFGRLLMQSDFFWEHIAIELKRFPTTQDAITMYQLCAYVIKGVMNTYKEREFTRVKSSGIIEMLCNGVLHISTGSPGADCSRSDEDGQSDVNEFASAP